MKTLKITPPEGYEIDKDKSTFEEIVFKPVKKKLPKTWEELDYIDGFFVTPYSEIAKISTPYLVDPYKNLFATESQAKASIALAQLSQLREVYRGGWEPDWSDPKYKPCINKNNNKICPVYMSQRNSFLCFQSEEIRDEFLANFKDLIEEASPLLFG